MIKKFMKKEWKYYSKRSKNIILIQLSFMFSLILLSLVTYGYIGSTAQNVLNIDDFDSAEDLQSTNIDEIQNNQNTISAAMNEKFDNFETKFKFTLFLAIIVFALLKGIKDSLIYRELSKKKFSWKKTLQISVSALVLFAIFFILATYYVNNFMEYSLLIISLFLLINGYVQTYLPLIFFRKHPWKGIGKYSIVYFSTTIVFVIVTILLLILLGVLNSNGWYSFIFMLVFLGLYTFLKTIMISINFNILKNE